MRKAPTLLIILTSVLGVIPANAVNLRVATFNIRLGLGEEGILERDAAEDVIARVNPDVIGLQEVYSADFAGNPSFLDDLASDLGFPHIFSPPVAIDPQSRVGIRSKFPFLNTWGILSPAGANDMTRAAAAALIDVPGTEADPIVVNAHLKCCLEFDDPFRRAVEMQRINAFLIDQGYDSADNIFILGDFNLIGSSVSFNTLPGGLPASYVIGNDITYPVTYSSNPVHYFSSLGMENPDYRQQNGSSTATHSSGSILDHILVSGPIFDRNPQTEIYKSTLDATFPGLSKSGSPLPANTSSDASDHFLVFGDFEIDGGDALVIETSASTLSETFSPIDLTVTLPDAPGPGESVTVNLTSSDQTELVPTSATLVFSAGQLTATTTLEPRPDLIIDGDQLVTVQASASGFNSASTNITVADSDTSTYLLTEINAPWLQTFVGFNGDQTPAAWNVSNNNWQGPDDGSLEIRGPRSYGSSSLGNLSGSSDTFTANFQNTTGETIRSLSLSYLAEQWRSDFNGSADQWKVTLIIGGIRTEIDSLEFTADTTQPSGSLAPPLSQEMEGLATGLNIPTGGSFQLEFQSVPGTPGASESDDVFINEIHYDNASNDQGEFVEVVVGPGFTDPLSTIELVLYNGNGGTTYSTPRSLDTFMSGNLCNSCHRIFYSEISGIQNGAPDGMALVIDGNVTQFISYEGSFTATNGPASGMTSINIGASQSNSTPVGMNSIGLSGEGAEGIDFSWGTLAGIHTPGQINPGQTFSAGSNPQGIAIDNLILIPSSQASGLLPPGISDLELTAGNTIRLTIPTWDGFDYVLESSDDLVNWNTKDNHTGDGLNWTSEYPLELQQYFRVLISPSE